MDKEEINFDCDNKTRKTEKQPKKKKAPRGRGKEAKKQKKNSKDSQLNKKNGLMINSLFCSVPVFRTKS